MTRISILRDQRRAVARETRNLLDSHPGKLWTARQQQTFDRNLDSLDRLDQQIGEFDRQREAADSVFATYLRDGIEGFTAEQRQQYFNTLSTTTGSQGGYAVRSDVSARFVDALKDFSGVRRVAEVIVSERGNAMPWPTSDGTSETGELVAENATATAADPTFGTAALPTYRYSSKIFTVPLELLQDASIDIEQMILDRAAQRIGRITNTQFTVGTGSGQPQGFAGVATSGKVGTTGQTLTVIHDDLVDLVHSVNTGYRQDPRGGVCFQMADTTFKVVRKLKDSSLRPIYLPDEADPAETVLGYPVIVNDDCATPAANAKSIFFGNFKAGYKVRDALAVLIFRFDDSAYTKLGQVGFLAFARCGGNLVDTASVKYYQHSAT